MVLSSHGTWFFKNSALFPNPAPQTQLDARGEGGLSSDEVCIRSLLLPRVPHVSHVPPKKYKSGGHSVSPGLANYLGPPPLCGTCNPTLAEGRERDGVSDSMHRHPHVWPRFSHEFVSKNLIRSCKYALTLPSCLHIVIPAPLTRSSNSKYGLTFHVCTNSTMAFFLANTRCSEFPLFWTFIYFNCVIFPPILITIPVAQKEFFYVGSVDYDGIIIRTS